MSTDGNNRKMMAEAKPANVFNMKNLQHRTPNPIKPGPIRAHQSYAYGQVYNKKVSGKIGAMLSPNGDDAISEQNRKPHYVLPIMYLDSEPYVQNVLPVLYPTNYPRPPIPPRHPYYPPLPHYDNNYYPPYSEPYNGMEHYGEQYYSPQNNSYYLGLNGSSPLNEYEYCSTGYSTIVPKSLYNTKITTRLTRGSQTAIGGKDIQWVTTPDDNKEILLYTNYPKDNKTKKNSIGTQTNEAKEMLMSLTSSNAGGEMEKVNKINDYDSVMKKMNKYFYKSLENQINTATNNSVSWCSMFCSHLA